MKQKQSKTHAQNKCWLKQIKMFCNILRPLELKANNKCKAKQNKIKNKTKHNIA